MGEFTDASSSAPDYSVVSDRVPDRLAPDDVSELLGLDHRWPRPGWRVLDAARDRRFTGELLFDSLPPIRVSFENGRIYLAERVNDPWLGARLADAGALDRVQLEQGTVTIDGMRHLGWLFERVPSVDRQRVMIVFDLMNDEATAFAANQVVRGVQAVAYRHHPSGVHRWLQLPGLAGAPTLPYVAVPSPLPGVDGRPLPGDDGVTVLWHDPHPVRGDGVVDTARDGDGAFGIEAVLGVEPLPLPVRDVGRNFTVDEPAGRFEVRWPSGEIDSDLREVIRPASFETVLGSDVPDDAVVAIRRTIERIEAPSWAPPWQPPEAPAFEPPRVAVPLPAPDVIELGLIPVAALRVPIMAELIDDDHRVSVLERLAGALRRI